MTEATRSAFETLKTDLHRVADEVRVKAHLGARDVHDLWVQVAADLRTQIGKLREHLRS